MNKMWTQSRSHLYIPFLFIFFIFSLSSCALSKRHYSSNPAFHKKQTYTTIIIDAGHGGTDPGTKSSNNIYKEKNLTFTTALMVKDHLESLGYNVAITRQRDIFIPLKDRSHFANNRGPALFISIHFNSAPNRKAHGIEIFFYSSRRYKLRSQTSKALADKVLAHILKYTKANDRGIKHGDFHVIREALVPAILIEGGFLSNKQEMKKLKSPRYLNRIAWGIVQGIDDFIRYQF